MKKILLLTVAILLVMGMTSFAAEYKDGNYIGFVPGDRDNTVVEVSIYAGKIVDVNIISPVKMGGFYDYEPGVEAFLEYPARVLANQSTDVDVVSGATGSFATYNKGVQMALDIASGNYDGDKFYGLAKNFAHGHVLVEITKDGKSLDSVNFITNDAAKDNVTLMEAKPANYPSEPAKEFYNTFGDKAVKAANDGSFEVDLISGATHSFHSYNAAFRHALEQAGFDV